ncbi:MAG: GNAT family N-acetyltransferase [Patescibacteria group bacterium]
MEYKVREATIADLRRISYITKLAWKIPYNKLGFVNNFHEHENLESLFLEKKIKILVAISDYKIVGSLRYELLKKNKIYFSKLVVLKSFRNKGVATALINELENIARKQKIKIISLDIMEEKLLLPFYKKFGFEIIKKIKYERHHEIYMEKILNKK